MDVRSIAFAAGLSVAAWVPATAVGAAGSRSVGIEVPLRTSSAGSGATGDFDGTLRIVRFGVDRGQLVAVALVSGTLVDAAGARTAIVRSTRLPVGAATAPTTVSETPLLQPVEPAAPSSEAAPASVPDDGSSGNGSADPADTSGRRSTGGGTTATGMASGGVTLGLGTGATLGSASVLGTGATANGTARTQSPTAGAAANPSTDPTAAASAIVSASDSAALVRAACEGVHLEMGPVEIPLPGLSIRLDRILVDLEPAVGTLSSAEACSAAAPAQGATTNSLLRAARQLNRLMAIRG